MKQIGIIGAGAMGSAIAQALIASQQWEVVVYDTDPNQVSKIQGCSPASSLEELVSGGDLFLLAVKPQVLPSLFPALREAGSASRRWISIAAGVNLATLTEGLDSREIVRYMPNLAAKVCQSVTAVVPSDAASASFTEETLEIAHLFGSAFLLPEEQIAAFTGISGSAIAFVFQFIHALAMGGVREGMPYPFALGIARDTCLSAAMLQKESNEHPVTLATMVCSAGGTTIEGMAALAQGGFDATIMEAVSASVDKFHELEEQARQ